MPARDRARDERGQVGGVEVLPFGFLVLVVGVLLVANAWGVIDAKLAAESAAREATRAYVESPDEAAALARGQAAAEAAMQGHHRPLAGMRVEPPPAGSFVRCRLVAYTVRYDVPTLALPWIGGFGGHVLTVVARHAERVDPYRSGIAGVASCGP
jgi:hypothetical protein